MNVGNIYDSSVKIFPFPKAGFISLDGYFGYLLALIFYGAFTQTFDLIKRNLSDCSSSMNMSSHRLIDTDRHFSKNCLKPCETKIYIQARKAILYRIKSIPYGPRPTQGRYSPTRLENSEA